MNKLPYTIRFIALAVFAMVAQQSALALPDVLPQSITLSSSTVAPGGTLTVTFNIANQGTTSAAATTTRLRLNQSSSSTSVGDTSLGDVSTPSIAAGGVASGLNKLVTIPAGTAAGTYYIWIVADNGSVLTQPNYANDYAHSPALTVQVTGQPDVLPQSITLSSSTVAPGGTLTVTFNIANQGTASAAATTTRLRLNQSASSTSVGDTSLGDVSTPSISAGGVASGLNKLVTIPAGTAAGTYYVWVVADNGGVLTQPNYANDYAHSPALSVVVAGQPDVLPQSITLSSSTVAPGGTLTVTFNIANQGTASAAATTTRLRLNQSASSTSVGDTSLGDVSTPSISAGGMASGLNKLVTIPAGTAAGTYYIWVVADNGGVLTQPNYANDYAHSSALSVVVAGQPDVLPQSITLSSSTVAPGGTLTVTFNIANQGTASAAATTTRLRLNQSAAGTSVGDTSLGDVSTPSIAAGGVASGLNKLVTIPAGTAAGTYYIWVVADNGSVLSQSNTANDYNHSLALTVQVAGQPDILPQNITLSSNTVAPGGTLTMTFNIANQGTASAAATTTRLRLNQSAAGTSVGDTSLGDVSTPSIAAGGVASGLNKLVTIPAGTAVGTYYIWVVADNGSVLTQSNTANDYAHSLALTVQTGGSGFYLSFPLAGVGAYTANISSVFDHSMTTPYCPNSIVTAYSGESGTVVDLNEPPATSGSSCLGQSLYSYKKANSAAFVVNGHYVGTQQSGPTTLNYDGHSGIDYPVTVGTDVFAAADGVAHWVVGSIYNTIYIDHGNSYTTHYLHLSQRLVADGATVTRGQRIALSGEAGAVGSPHLHFEVKLNSVSVDPYGWEGAGADPYTAATSVNLWNSAPACSYSLNPSSRSHGSSADSGSIAVTAGSGCAWTATPSVGWITITSGSSGSSNGAVNYSVTANAGSSLRNGSITVQGQVFSIAQAGVGTAGYPSATWTGPAASGNYETGRSANTLDKIIIHTIEGSAQSALNRFQTAGQIASSHYIVGTNGAIWQVVSDADTAYHCGNLTYNRQAIGIELEGWAGGNPTGNFSWQTDAQFNALQGLVAWLISQYSIPLDRAHIIGHNQVPSPGGASYPPTTQWGGASNHYDTGAWWNWRRLMTALGHAPTFTVLQVSSATSITTLPQAGAPIITPTTTGQRFVAYDSQAGYYLVFLSGVELPQDYQPAGGEFHWDGWIPAANVTLPSGISQLEVSGVFPGRLNIRNAAGTTGTSVIAKTIDGKRYVATGNTQVADGYTWREFYIATVNNAVATGWAITDNLTVISGGGGASSPTISNPKRTGTSFTLSVPTQIGFNYVLEYKSSFAEANWTAVQTNSGSGGMIGLTNNGATGVSRVYRVRVQ